jgi:hypothetical protein
MSFRMLVLVYQTTWCQSPEDSDLHSINRGLREITAWWTHCGSYAVWISWEFSKNLILNLSLMSRRSTPSEGRTG